MKCDELKLFLFLEGKCSEGENSEIREHLSSCSRCRLKHERMKFTVDCFTSYYRKEKRAACPSADEIVSYQEGELEPGRSKEIKAHLADCPLCSEELLLLRQCDAEEDPGREGALPVPQLSRAVLEGVDKLRKTSLRDRMEHVLKTLSDKGREALTPEKITEALQKYLFPYQEPLPAHAMPAVTARFDTELELNDSAVCDISVNIGAYTLAIKAIDDTLAVKVMLGDRGVSGVEVVFMTRNLGARKALTGRDGSCVIAGIRQGPYQISIKVPEGHDT